MGNPSHSALCSRCILCNVQPSISLMYNTLDNMRSTCLIRKVQQTHLPRVCHFFIDHCNVQYSISLAYNTLDNTRSTCSMCNVQQTHLSLGYVTRPQTNATCNPQHLRRTFCSTIRSTCSIRNVQQTHLESERSRQGTHFITDECTHRRQQQLIDICWNQAL